MKITSVVSALKLTNRSARTIFVCLIVCGLVAIEQNIPLTRGHSPFAKLQISYHIHGYLDHHYAQKFSEA